MYKISKAIYEPNRTITIKSTSLSNWYRVEWLEHRNIRWEEEEKPTKDKPYSCIYLRDSARLDPYTCVEGSLPEMKELCGHILSGQDYSDTRCAITTSHILYVGFYSPRNSNGRIVYVNRGFAREAAQKFLLKSS
jgi:hypothetical protein